MCVHVDRVLHRVSVVRAKRVWDRVSVCTYGQSLGSCKFLYLRTER